MSSDRTFCIGASVCRIWSLRKKSPY